MKSEITPQITTEKTKIHTVLNDVKADTDKQIDELKQIMEPQHSKEMEFIKQIQADINENKNSTENIGSRLGQCEDRISHIEDRIAFSEQEKKYFSEIVKDHEK